MTRDVGDRVVSGEMYVVMRKVRQTSPKATVVRSRDLPARARRALPRLCNEGQLERIGWGLYLRTDAELTEHHGLVEASLCVPQGVICLLSALVFHELTTQAPPQVWLALPGNARQTRRPHLSLRIVRFSPECLGYGVVHPLIEGVRVPLTSPAKTVADCFKFRSKVGIDVAVEALRKFLEGSYWGSKRRWDGGLDALREAAQVCRVERVMAPYLEALA